MTNEAKMILLERRYQSLETTIDILNEMTPQEMTKAGYSKAKQKVMGQWIKMTIAVLDGLSKEYRSQWEELRICETE